MNRTVAKVEAATAVRPRGKKGRQISRAAVEVFSRRGFHAATMDEVAKEAGVGKGTLYYYVGGKQELLGLVVASTLAELDETLFGGLSELDAVGKIEGIVRRHVGFVYERRKTIQLVMSLVTTPAHTQFLSRVKNFWHTYIGRVAAIIEEGMARGAMRSVDARGAAGSLVGMLVFLGMRLTMVGQLDSEQAAADSIIDLFMKGVLEKGSGTLEKRKEAPEEWNGAPEKRTQEKPTGGDPNAVT